MGARHRLAGFLLAALILMLPGELHADPTNGVYRPSMGPNGLSSSSGSGGGGAPGQAATITVGTTTTGAPGSAANVTNSGTTSAAKLNFIIPQGAAGTVGGTPTITIGPVNTGAPGSQATVTDTVNGLSNSFSFSLPQGATGAAGSASSYQSPTVLSGVQTITASMCGLTYQSSDSAPVTYTVSSGLTNCKAWFIQGGAGQITFAGQTTSPAVTVNAVGGTAQTTGQWATVVLKTLNSTNQLVLGTD